jgi:hypothetical protein
VPSSLEFLPLLVLRQHISHNLNANFTRPFVAEFRHRLTRKSSRGSECHNQLEAHSAVGDALDLSGVKRLALLPGAVDNRTSKPGRDTSTIPRLRTNVKAAKREPTTDL